MVDSQVILATDALMVGIDLPNVEDVLVLSPKNLDKFLQKIVRAGRNRLGYERSSRDCLYYEASNSVSEEDYRS